LVYVDACWIDSVVFYELYVFLLYR